ncbi:metallophosphoesterase [Okeania sp.]|uniref:metallophosphoesterase family protein n=1 Tax=Okeania sp. TaxID=3100323 RepID=UPI002B4AE6FF|nr:metallophosphoesterase [Okeania sp.]MEB3340278.1 metallophosphoesterase [Okeania sp.]
MKFNRRNLLIFLSSLFGLGFAVTVRRIFSTSQTLNVKNTNSQLPEKATISPSEIPTPSTSAPSGMFAPKKGDIRLVVISDLNSRYGSTNYESQVEKTIPLISEWKPDLVLCAGDMVAGQKLSLTEENIQAMWDGFDSYIFTPLRQIKQPFAITIGNHDASGYTEGGEFIFAKERRLAQEYWSQHQKDLNIEFLEAEKFPFYYSFLHKNIFYLIWDASSFYIPTEQLEWVEKSLASSQAQTAKMRIVMGHLPLYAVAVGRNKFGNVLAEAEELQTLLEKYNVHLYISGHHHAYFPGYKGNLKLLFTGALGSGPRVLLNSNLPPRNTLTIVDINLQENKSFFTTYNMNTLAVIEPEELPETITGFNGSIQRISV